MSLPSSMGQRYIIACDYFVSLFLVLFRYAGPAFILDYSAFVHIHTYSLFIDRRIDSLYLSLNFYKGRLCCSFQECI